MSMFPDLLSDRMISDVCFAVFSSPVLVRETKPFNDVESCLLQEEICGGRGYTGEPSWIFTKSICLSSFYHFSNHSRHVIALTFCWKTGVKNIVEEVVVKNPCHFH